MTTETPSEYQHLETLPTAALLAASQRLTGVGDRTTAARILAEAGYDGWLVIEAEHEAQIVATLGAVQSLPGVINAALVYHEVLEEQDSSLPTVMTSSPEMPDETQQT